MILRKTFMVLHRFQWRQLNPKSKIGMGAHASRVRVQASRLNFQHTNQKLGGVENFVGRNFRRDAENHTPEACATKNLPARLVSIFGLGLKAIWPNPKGIVSSSPGLRGTSYPGSALQNPTNPNGVAAIPQGRLLRLGQYGDGARASARFNAQSCGAHKTPSPLAVWTLKRRERRAPLAPLPCHSVSGGSITCQHRPQPRWGCDSPAAVSQGSSCLATLGFEPESLWDSHRRRHRK